MSAGARAVAVAVMLATLASAARAACPSVVAGSCWVIDATTVTVTSSAAAYGHSVRCALRCRTAGGAAIVLRDDGTYSMPATTGGVGCRAGSTLAVPDEQGTIRRKRTKLVLEPTNRAALEAFFDACGGEDVALRRIRTTLRPAEDGATLSGVTKVRTSTQARVPVSTDLKVRFTATRADIAGPAVPIARAAARTLPSCSDDLTPRCVSD